MACSWTCILFGIADVRHCTLDTCFRNRGQAQPILLRHMRCVKSCAVKSYDGKRGWAEAGSESGALLNGEAVG
jgi:hypothetical protein